MLVRLKSKLRENKLLGDVYLKIAILLKGKLSKESLYFCITQLCKVKKNKIVFCAFEGKGFTDNPKYIALELLKLKQYDLVWLVKDIHDSSIPNEIRKVQYGTFDAVYELATAKVWIDNARKGWATIKKNNQYYIHTGHGGVPLKRVEADAPTESVGLGYKMMAQHDSKQIDLMISNSRFRTDIYKNSYWYNGEVAEWGSPKIEALKEKDFYIEKKVKDYWKLNGDVRLAIYAPTFRSNSIEDLELLNIEYNKLLRVIKNKFGGEWKILVRIHPNIADNAKELGFIQKDILNATFYPDMQELMTAADIMITDYSGTMFEMMHINKPVFLFVPDMDEYNRGLYFDMHELPFPFAKNENMLYMAINEFNMELYKIKVNEFKENIGFINNYNSSKKCAERIQAIIDNKFIWKNKEK